MGERPRRLIKTSRFTSGVGGHDGPGYVDAGTLTGYIGQAQRTWSSFGEVTLWEASLAISLYDMSDVTTQ